MLLFAGAFTYNVEQFAASCGGMGRSLRMIVKPVGVSTAREYGEVRSEGARRRSPRAPSATGICPYVVIRRRARPTSPANPPPKSHTAAGIGTAEILKTSPVTPPGPRRLVARTYSSP